MSRSKTTNILLSVGIAAGLVLAGLSCLFSSGILGNKNKKQEETISNAIPIQYGIGAPDDSFGENGDIYVDSTTNERYTKINGEWVPVNGYKGEKGDKGDKGDQGVSIVSIEKYSTAGNVDTYRITYSDGTYSTFTVTNGADGQPGARGQAGSNGRTPVVTIGSNGNWFIDGVDSGVKAQGPKGDDGVSIVSVVKTNTVGNIDTYTITYSNGETSTFTVANGKNPVITIGENGNWYVDDTDTGVKAQGERGEQGVSILSITLKASSDTEDTYTITYSDGTWCDIIVKHGHSPSITINESGYWCIDGVNTGVKAKGDDGQAGVSIVSVELILTVGNEDTYKITYSNGDSYSFTVTNGEDGPDGITPHIGENGNWWFGENDSGIPAGGLVGESGVTPHIGDNGNWFIGTTDTGISAQGEDGITPHIGDNGNWFIGGVDTGVSAEGAEGITPHIGDNGNWFVGETDTGIKAQGEDGSDGKSAYDLYKETYGYDGTEQEWLDDLANGRLVNQPKYKIEYYDGNGRLLYTVDDVAKVGSTAYVGPEPTKLPSNNLKYQFSGEWTLEGVSEGSRTIKYIAKFNACSLGLTIEQGKVLDYNVNYINTNGSVIIPKAWDGYKVTEIAPRAFYGKTEVKSVEIPCTVEWIEYQAFANSGLLLVVLPSSVRYIDQTAYDGCSNIYYVYFDAVLERELEEDTYDNCYKFFESKSSIKNVVIGPHVKSVPNGLFYNCSHIQRVEIMEGVEYVNSQVFDYVTDMTYLSLPESLVAFESGTFPWNIFGKDKLTNYYKKGFYLGKPSNPYFALVRTDDYDEMGTGEEFELHPDCRELLTLPEDFDAGDTYTFPDQLTALSGPITYYGFDSTTEIIVPDSVVYLQSDFGGLYSLKSITFGTGITEVNTNCLCQYDEELESVTFNGDVVNLRPVDDESYYMFAECYSLNEFHIPTRSLRYLSIGFNGYDCLDDVENNLTTYGNGVYYGDDDNPYAILAKPIDSSIENITVHKDCKIIGKYALYECSNLTTVEFEEGCSVFNFENGAFYRADQLTNITLPDTLEILGNQAFYECNSLTEIEIPSSTYYIGQTPFYETGITELEIPNTVKHLGWGVCYIMKKLETVVINADVEYLPRSCFYENFKLVSVTLNNKIRQIREEAFAYCRLLESVTLPANTVSISREAFYRNEVLQTIECPKYLGVIREEAFRECGNLASIGINNRLRNVEKNAFNGCNHLSVIIYRGSVSERTRWLTVDSNAGMMNVSSWHYTNYII